jgi:NAD dependent epimerase/dehydratase family enzyme
MSWVSLADAAQVVAEALEREEIEGAVNVAAPEPVRNRDFARALGKVLRRPALLPAPPFALRLVLGAMADEALLASARVAPARLTTLGYRFAFGDLDRAIRTALKR